MATKKAKSTNSTSTTNSKAESEAVDFDQRKATANEAVCKQLAQTKPNERIMPYKQAVPGATKQALAAAAVAVAGIITTDGKGYASKAIADCVNENKPLSVSAIAALPMAVRQKYANANTLFAICGGLALVGGDRAIIDARHKGVDITVRNAAARCTNKGYGWGAWAQHPSFSQLVAWVKTVAQQHKAELY